MKSIWSFLAANLLAVAALAGCSRDHIKAVELSNEGDKMMKSGNTNGALEKYKEANDLAPNNHEIMYRLGIAYKKSKKYDKAASELAEAGRLAESFANYHFHRGHALILKAEQLQGKGQEQAYEEAKAPLEQCIKKDAEYAECYFWLAEAFRHTGDDNKAAQYYTQAIQHDPKDGKFWPPLVKLYLTYKMYDEVRKVVEEGTRMLEPTKQNGPKLILLYRAGYIAARAGDKKDQMVDLLEKALALDVEGKDPMLNFDLGSTYAQMDGKKSKAVRYLKSFEKLCNKGTKGKETQCEQASVLLRELESN